MFWVQNNFALNEGVLDLQTVQNILGKEQFLPFPVQRCEVQVLQTRCRCRHACGEVQRCRGVEVQRCRCELQLLQTRCRCRHAMERCRRCADVQMCRGAEVQRCRGAGVQRCTGA